MRTLPSSIYPEMLAVVTLALFAASSVNLLIFCLIS
jgi:hypothetical protein